MMMRMNENRYSAHL